VPEGVAVGEAVGAGVWPSPHCPANIDIKINVNEHETLFKFPKVILKFPYKSIYFHCITL